MGLFPSCTQAHPELLREGFPCCPASPWLQVALPWELPSPAQGVSCCCPCSRGTELSQPSGPHCCRGDCRAVGGYSDIPIPFPVPFPIFPAPSWSAARDQAESKDQNPQSSLTVNKKLEQVRVTAVTKKGLNFL